MTGQGCSRSTPFLIRLSMSVNFGGLARQQTEMSRGEKMPLCQASVVHSVFIVHDRRLGVCLRRMWPWR